LKREGEDMTRNVDVYYDYVCPYTYVASKREPLLKADYDVEFNWKSWEIHPERPHPPLMRRSVTPSYITASLGREINVEFTLPEHRSNSRNALIGAEIAKKMGKFKQYHESIWRVHWDEKKDIADLDVLKGVASNAGIDPEIFERELSNPEFNAILKQNDKEADRIGVESVPSYVLGKRIVVGNIFMRDLKRELERFLRT
jgi:predicted DsbA family dithiol-disulfide isomerase